MKRNVCVHFLFGILTVALLTVVAACHDDNNDSGPTGLDPEIAKLGGGTTYYVAPEGNDNHVGTKDRPWRTIQKAAETIVSGDTVYIRSGTYRERVVPRHSGSAYITYAAYPGETVTIDGSGVSLPSDMAGLFEVSGMSNLRISGLRIINAGPGDNHAGILVTHSKNIIIEHNHTYNTASSGIGVWESSNVIITGNDVQLCCNDGEQECITIANTKIFEVRHNHVHHGGSGTIGGEGIDAKDGSSYGRIYKNHVHHLTNRVGIYVDAWDKHTYDIEVYQNSVHHIANNDGFALASEEGGLLEDIRVYNNIAYNNGLSGIVISDAGAAAIHPLRSVSIINNTLYNNGRGSWGGGISVENPNVNTLLIRNNICSQNKWFQIQTEVPVQGLFIDHNLIYGNRGDDENDGSNVVQGNPWFVNASRGDFHLQNASPAIDSGTSHKAPARDFDGFPRPQGKGYDIGAFER